MELPDLQDLKNFKPDLAMDKKTREQELFTLFRLGLVIKLLGGVLEMAGAIAIALFPPTFVLKIANLVTQGELSNDPDDPLATAIQEAAQTFSIHKHIALELYLFTHGFVKLVLVLMIFAGKRIAYPLFMIALVMFGVYETYRGIVRDDYLLLAFAIFDFALFAITFHEYKRLRKNAPLI